MCGQLLVDQSTGERFDPTVRRTDHARPTHGAGAGTTHPFMAAVAEGLTDRSIAALRYQFPYMEQGSKRPDRPEIARATVRAAAKVASRLLPGVPCSRAASLQGIADALSRGKCRPQLSCASSLGKDGRAVDGRDARRDG